MKYNEIGTKKLRYLWSILAVSSVVDADTQNLTINNLIEQITINVGSEDVEKKKKDGTNGYAFSIPIHIVSRVMKKVYEGVQFQLKFELLNPVGKVLISMSPQNVEMKKEIKNLRLRSTISPLLVDGKGEYTIRVLIKESDEAEFTEMDRVPLEVDLVEAMPIQVN